LFERRFDDDEVCLGIVDEKFVLRHSVDLRKWGQFEGKLVRKIFYVSRVTLNNAPRSAQVVADPTRQRMSPRHAGNVGSKSDALHRSGESKPTTNPQRRVSIRMA